jgi:hypothetical protein
MLHIWKGYSTFLVPVISLQKGKSSSTLPSSVNVRCYKNERPECYPLPNLSEWWVICFLCLQLVAHIDPLLCVQFDGNGIIIQRYTHKLFDARTHLQLSQQSLEELDILVLCGAFWAVQFCLQLAKTWKVILKGHIHLSAVTICCFVSSLLWMKSL